MKRNARTVTKTPITKKRQQPVLPAIARTINIKGVSAKNAKTAIPSAIGKPSCSITTSTPGLRYMASIVPQNAKAATKRLCIKKNCGLPVFPAIVPMTCIRVAWVKSARAATTSVYGSAPRSITTRTPSFRCATNIKAPSAKVAIALEITRKNSL